MKDTRKLIQNRLLIVFCSMLFAVLLITPIGFKPQTAHAACSHIWQDEKIMNQPTCSVNGAKMQRCKKCGSRRTISISKKGHTTNGSFTIAQYPTCTTPGKRVLKCTRCAAILNTQTIPATGNHNWKQNKIFQKATCTTNGCIQEICSMCHQTRMTYPPQLAHQSYKRYDYNKKKSYMECTVCGTKYNYQDLTEDTCPVQGTRKKYQYNYFLSKIYFEGEINPDNHFSNQYLKLDNDSNLKTGSLLLSTNEKKADFYNDGIRLKFNEDGSVEAFLKYTTDDDNLNEEIYDNYKADPWKHYAWVKYSDEKIVIYPQSRSWTKSDVYGESNIIEKGNTCTLDFYY